MPARTGKSLPGRNATPDPSTAGLIIITRSCVSCDGVGGGGGMALFVRIWMRVWR